VLNLLGRDCVQDCTGCLRVASDYSEFPSVTGLGGDVGRGPNSVINSLVFAFVQYSVIVYKSGLIFPYYFISVDIILKFRIISRSTLFTPPSSVVCHQITILQLVSEQVKRWHLLQTLRNSRKVTPHSVLHCLTDPTTIIGNVE
jgi:hypothetical protein